MDDLNTETIPLVEETAFVGKRDVVGETVEVRTHVVSDTKTLEADLLKENVDVRRVSHETVLAQAPSVRTEGDTTIIPVVREELFVQKRLVLVEEIHLTRRRETRPVTADVELRRTEAEIVRAPD